ncbi:MAG: hypothetical protein R6V54_03610 [Desulfobacteraceae bacterium]
MADNGILHDGLYEWDGTARPGKKPICWWPGSYRIRIVNLALHGSGIRYLRPVAVICQNNGSGTSVHSCIQNFAKEISKEYNLEMEKTLWVEISHTPPFEIQAATFTLVSDLAGNKLFSTKWRDLRPNEVQTLEPYLADFRDED